MPNPALLTLATHFASHAAGTGGRVLALNPLDSTSWLSSLGALGVFLVLFAETGLLIGFFLPGDSLLFTAGLLCTAGTHAVHLSLPAVLLAAAAGALLGAQTGFWLGQRGGRALLARTKNRHVREGVMRAEEILERYGHGKAIVLARFIPVVRTVLNPMAGALEVPTRVFTLWQVVGGLVWSLGVTLAGYGLGSSIPSIDKYLLPIIALIVIVSLSPLAVELLRRRRAGASQPGPGTRPDSAARPDAVSQPDSVWRPDPESRPFPTSRPSPRSDSAAASHARHAASEDY